MNKTALKYACCTTLITAMIIVFILLLVRSGANGISGNFLNMLGASLFWIPVLSVFCTGYFTFGFIGRGSSTIKVILIAIVHFILAHGLSFLLNIANFTTRELEAHPVKQATDILWSSLLFGSGVTFPAYILIAFLLNDNKNE